MQPTPSSAVTQLLHDWSQGNQTALDKLVPLVYGELRKVAQGYLGRERSDHTLQPTALIHEAYLRLVDQTLTDWETRTHFFGIAARLMRQILVDHARRRAANKRGSGALRVSLDEIAEIPLKPTGDLLVLNDALDALSAFDERKARIIELRYFGGLSVEETAKELKVSVSTVGLESRLAEAWLRHEVGKHRPRRHQSSSGSE